MKKIAYITYFDNRRTKAFSEYFKKNYDLLYIDCSDIRNLYRSTEKNTIHEKSVLEYKKIANFITNQKIKFIINIFYFQFFLLLSTSKVLFGKYDFIVISNAHPLFSLFLGLSHFFGKKIIIDQVDMLFFDEPRTFGYRFEKYFLSKAFKIVAVTDVWKEYLEKNTINQNISTIKQCIDINDIDIFCQSFNEKASEKIKNDLNLTSDTILLSFTGSTWIKEIDGVKREIQGRYQVLEALAKLIKMGEKNYHFVIIGSPLTEQEKNIISTDKLESYISHLGVYKLFDEKHLQVLGGCDIHIAPSVHCMTYTYFDRFKFLEYLGSGKKVLSSDTPANREILGEYGVFFEEENIEALVQEIQNFDVDVYNSKIRSFIEKHYVWEKYLDKLDF